MLSHYFADPATANRQQVEEKTVTSGRTHTPRRPTSSLITLEPA